MKKDKGQTKSSTKYRGSPRNKTKELLAGRGDLSSGKRGTLPLLMAIASSARCVSIDPSESGIATTPKDILTLRLGDPRIGIRSASQIAVLRRNLRQLVPQIADRVREIPLTSASSVSQAADLVSKLLADSARPVAPTLLKLGTEGDARKRVANKWGKAFASKSSPALIQQLTAPTREAFSLGAVTAPGLILEFSEQSAAVGDNVPNGDRTERVASLRDAFYKVASPIRVAIEGSTGSLAVQVCWLNSTMRVAGQVAAVAAVADASEIRMLDVARALRREMNVAGVTVHIAAARANSGVTGKGVRVAVIDGEVNIGHPALAGRVTLQENFTSEAFGTPDAHGTAVAGIIAAADGTFGGVAPDALILNYKVFATNSDTGDEFQGILAIEHALRDGIDVANCSWGIGAAGDGTGREAKAFNTAWQEGLILIKSAGNGGPGANTMTSPADADGVVVVGATDRAGTAVQDYSSRGPTANGKRPHLVAPGGTAASNMETCLAGAGGGFGQVSYGTSLAAPVISGAAALLRQKFRGDGPDAIRQRLVQMCRPFAANDPDADGVGLLDLSLL